MKNTLALMITASLVVAAGCIDDTSSGDDTGPRVCEPSITEACFCVLGDGTKTCKSDGSGWSECQCTIGDTKTDSETDTEADHDTNFQCGPDPCALKRVVSSFQPATPLSASFSQKSFFNNTGIVDMIGNSLGNLYAISADCALYSFDGQDWTGLSDHFVSEPGACRGLSALMHVDEIFVVGSNFHDDERLFPFPLKAEIEHLMVRSSDGFRLGHATECTPDNKAAWCWDEFVDQLDGDVFRGAWFEGMFGFPDGKYLLIGGWSYGSPISPVGDSTESQLNQIIGEGHSRGMMDLCEIVYPDDPREFSFDCQDVEFAPNIPLSDAWGVSSTELYVVGNDIQPVSGSYRTTGHVYRCNACECVLEAEFPDARFNAVWGFSMDDVYVVGEFHSEENMLHDSVILHRTERGWSAIDIGTTVPLNDVWGTSEEDVFVSGGYNDDQGTSSSFAMHYDGASWTELQFNAKKPLRAIWGSSATDVWFAGEEGFFHYTN
ncbi:MAG: hypothetical protein GY854_08060 [Deltaproteobacteria bacterium]|nr:hypothetical protein [Deltaproteobacteria bacterium]